MYVECICCINCRGCFCVVLCVYLEYVGDMGRVWVSMPAVERERERNYQAGINCRGYFCVVIGTHLGYVGGHGMYVGEHAICGEREREELPGGRYLNQPQTW